MAEQGDFVTVTTTERIFSGILMPSEGQTIVLKLTSGYNIGILKKNVTHIAVKKKHKPINQLKTKRIAPKKGLKNIIILHTGGTIASKVDYETGGTSSKFSPEEIVELIPELKSIVNIDAKLISNIFSEDMRFEHYNVLAKEIQKYIKKVEGIIITQGTDTLHYTAAALSFMLEHLPIPVILVGAQRSSDRGSSDAAVNMIAAAQFIAQTNFSGVAICMHEYSDDSSCVILPGTKSRKMHTSRRDAFKAINVLPYARVTEKEVEVLAPFPGKPTKEFSVVLLRDDIKIGIVYIHTHMYAEEFTQYKNYDGLVIIGTGLGLMPADDQQEHKRIYNALKQLTKKMPVIMTPQTIHGRVNHNTYAKGHILQEAGILGNFTDMLPETAFIKLAYLISKYKDNTKKIRELLVTNLCGEISQRSLYCE